MWKKWILQDIKKISFIRKNGTKNKKGIKIMNKLDYQEVQKHIKILNVAYHLCLEIVETQGYESKAICPFCRIQ